jgi:hypothetical protein
MLALIFKLKKSTKEHIFIITKLTSRVERTTKLIIKRATFQETIKKGGDI